MRLRPPAFLALALLSGSGVPLGCERPPTAAPSTTPASVETAPTEDPELERQTLYLAGAVDVPGGGKLQYFAKLEPNAGGPGYVGTIDIPAQGAVDVPLEDIEVNPATGRLAFVLPATPRARWEGKGAEGDTLACNFSQGPVTLPCTMDVLTEQALADRRKAERPQTPKPPFPYAAKEVTYRNDDADIELAGTLTIPQGEGPFPAALLITGSGSQDRDETIFEHKPFWVIADHLTRKGIAVLRVDDRGVGGSQEGPAGPTSEDFAGDVKAGVAFLATNEEIDRKRIGLIGHSEGGAIAPMVAAAQPKDIAFIVLLAGPGVRGDALLVKQAGLAVAAAGAPPEMVEQIASRQRRMLDLVMATKDKDALRKGLREALDESAAAAGQDRPDDATVDAQLAQVDQPWFRWFLAYDPAPTLRKVKCPVLALGGELDIQVDPEQNLPAIETALKKGRNRDATVTRMPGLNHLFQSADTGGIQEYAAIEETFSPDALEAISSWITKRMLR